MVMLTGRKTSAGDVGGNDICVLKIIWRDLLKLDL